MVILVVSHACIKWLKKSSFKVFGHKQGSVRSPVYYACLLRVSKPTKDFQEIVGGLFAEVQPDDNRQDCDNVGDRPSSCQLRVCKHSDQLSNQADSSNSGAKESKHANGCMGAGLDGGDVHDLSFLKRFTLGITQACIKCLKDSRFKVLDKKEKA